MITIHFIPIFEDLDFLSAAEEYKNIWAADGQMIISTLESVTGLSFQESRIAALVYEGMSFSGRTAEDIMRLRASYNIDVKKGTLIHELSHRLLFNFKAIDSLQDHKLLNLFLYDVWSKIYGVDFADRMVIVESERSEMYKNAWNYALSMTQDRRKEEFQNHILNRLQKP